MKEGGEHLSKMICAVPEGGCGGRGAAGAGAEGAQGERGAGCGGGHAGCDRREETASGRRPRHLSQVVLPATSPLMTNTAYTFTCTLHSRHETSKLWCAVQHRTRINTDLLHFQIS